MEGLHLIADWHECQCDKKSLINLTEIQAICLKTCLAHGLTPVTHAFHSFGSESGVTGAVVLAESHLALHTWPEKNAVTLDIYVCNYRADNSQNARNTYDSLRRHFQPGKIVCQEIHRGTPFIEQEKPA